MSSFAFGADKDLFIKIKEPVYGAIRFSSRAGGGHVCLVYGAIGDMLVVIGGNQGNRISFELISSGVKGDAFYVPIAYADYAKADGAVLPDVDVDALRREFKVAVDITDKQIKARETTNAGQA